MVFKVVTWNVNSITMRINHLIEFIKRLSMELSEQEIKTYELFKEKNYYVSDIVDYNNYTEKKGQKIIKSTNTKII